MSAMGSDPKTEAGRRLDVAWPASHLSRAEWYRAIRAIEEEAARLASTEGATREGAQRPIVIPADREGQVAGIAAALDEAISLVTGPGNGTWNRQRPIEEWQRLYRVFTEARARLGQREDAPLDAAPTAEDLLRAWDGIDNRPPKPPPPPKDPEMA